MFRPPHTRRQDRIWAARTMAEIEARIALGHSGDLWRDVENRRAAFAEGGAVR